MERAKKGFLYYFLRVFAVVALLCSLGVTAFLCWNSLRPADESSAISAGVSSSIKDNLDVKDNDTFVPLSSIDSPLHNSTGNIGDEKPFIIEYTPEKATNKKLIYTSSKPEIIDVGIDGTLYFKSYGRADVTATSVENGEISVTVELFCAGSNVTDLSGAYPTFSNEQNAKPCYTLKAGFIGHIAMRSNKGEIISVNTIEFTFSDPSVMTISARQFFAIKAGQTDITATSLISGDSVTFTVTVEENPSFIHAESLDFKEDEYSLNLGESFSPIANITSTSPANADIDRRFFEISIDNEEVLTGNKFYYKGISEGECNVKIVSIRYGTEFSFKVVVQEHVPTELSILGNDRINKNNVDYQAFGNDYYVNNVTWEVLSGNATVDEEGVLTPKGYGTVVLKATSNANPEVTATLEIQVSTFQDFGLFVRKIIGHFSAFFALGVGYAVSYFLLLKNKKNYFALSLLTTFVVACFTEILQLPIFVAGRGPSAGDAWLDFTGAFLGVLFTTVLYVVVRCIIRIFSKKKYENVKKTIYGLNGKSFFN